VENKDWIYPNESLPEPFTFVLATIETEHDKWVEEVGYNGTSFELPGRGITCNVIAWMPKPEPAIKQKQYELPYLQKV
jgi:hypothetical protein